MMYDIDDPQQYPVYVAQAQAFKNRGLDKILHGFDCISLIDKTFKMAYNLKAIEVAYRPLVQFIEPQEDWGGWAKWEAENYDCVIELTPGGMRPWVIMHECAHLIVKAGRPQATNFDNHGAEFARMFLWVTNKMFGRYYASLLKGSFIEQGVKF